MRTLLAALAIAGAASCGGSSSETPFPPEPRTPPPGLAPAIACARAADCGDAGAACVRGACVRRDPAKP